ncbi:MAG TPA: energy transducer TonB [Albitalea sp.]|uniref:energy transducer TonB n=1 Tax=Piscinibacter sp. TaxID=1903157 RepID=UPI002ED3C059
MVGITFVIAFHAFIVYALVTGLAKKVVDVVRAPIETKVIEEIKKPPPPPEIVVPPPPRLEAPPPPFIPPPEVQIQTPPPVQPTITAVTPTPPPAPVAIAPVAPPVTAPAAPPQPAVMSAAVVCSNYTTVMGDAGFPREAARQGIDKGEAEIQFTLSANGEIKDVKALRATHPIFARNSIRIVSEYKCQGQGRDVVVRVPFGYKLD